MTIKHFTHLHEWGQDGIMGLVDKALAYKKTPPQNRPLTGKSLAFCFMNPSLRTQVSFEAATAALGGHPITLFPGQGGIWAMERRDGLVMDGPTTEHVKEAVPVLGRYCSALGLRSFSEGQSWDEDKTEPWLSAFRRYSTVPIINMESPTAHPCQALADLMTIKERMDPRGKNFLLTWAPHVKALPLAVPQSAAEIAAMAGMNITIARPKGYDLSVEAMRRIKDSCRLSGAKLQVTDDGDSAFKNAHVVYAKAWGSLENYGQAPSAGIEFRKKWMLTKNKMSRTDKAIFMHCLPVRRNLVVADEVLDAPYSVVLTQAENRLHAAKAVLTTLTEDSNS
jgi:N-acetylornithine carbamoyltransferase